MRNYVVATETLGHFKGKQWPRGTIVQGREDREGNARYVDITTPDGFILTVEPGYEVVPQERTWRISFDITWTLEDFEGKRDYMGFHPEDAIPSLEIRDMLSDMFLDGNFKIEEVEPGS